MTRQKIAVIIPFYGKWPSYFPLYLKSCAYNQLLEIIFITDLELPADAPANVKKVHMTFDEVADRFSRKLERQTALSSYYKLCDFKPAYGFLFEEMIHDYIFWAFGDIDLLYGKVESFITEQMLQNYDVITFRKEWLSGALTLFRNTPEINQLFKESPDWEKVVSEKRHFSFTECATQYAAVMKAGSIFKVQLDIVPMSVVVKKAAQENRIRLFEEKWIKESIVKNDYVKFDDGVVSDNFNNQFVHYHFVSEKSKETFSYPSWKEIPNRFFVTRFGFFHDITSPVTSIVKLVRLLKSKRAKLTRKLKSINDSSVEAKSKKH